MDHLYKEIVSFQHKVNDRMDDPSHNLARSIKQEVQRLEDEAQVRKNPRSLEDRVKSIIRLFEEAEETEIMSHHHIKEMIEICEEFRQKLRKLS